MPFPPPRPRYTLALLALLAATGAGASAQTNTARPAAPAPAAKPAAPDLFSAARTVIAGAKHAAFITVDAQGRPQARTVQPMPPDSNFVVWFATNPRTRKVAEITRDGRASMYYYEAASEAYVTLIGNARVVRNRSEKDAHWNGVWSRFYPDRDTSVVLIEFTPERLEVVDIKRRVSGDQATWRPPTAIIKRRG